MSRTPTRAISLAVSAILATTALGAQELKRVVVQPTKGDSQQATSGKLPKGYFHEAPPVTATNITQDTNLPDVPDFVKSEDILDKDGNVVGIKKIGTPYLLDFTNGSYAPEEGIDPKLRAKLTSSVNASTFGFIMFKGRMSDERMQLLRDMGVKLIDAHTFQSMKAWIPASALAGLERASWIHWVGYAREHQKIDHNFVVPMATAKDDDFLPVIVNPFVSDLNKDTKWVTTGEKIANQWTVVDAVGATGREAIPNGPFHKALEQQFGFKFENYNEIIHNFEGKMRKKDILRLLKEDWVHTVELFEGKPTEDHDQAVPMVHQDFIRRYYDGKGVAVGCIDSGLDSTPWHNDHSGKYYVYWNNAITPTSDHGTHVMGTIWGRGAANKRYEGGAPAAGSGGEGNRIFLSRSDASLSSNAGLMGNNFPNGGKTNPYPRVISNSYSWKSSSGYYGSESNARTIDAASYNKKQLWVFSSGNKQSTANYWCGSPSSGKNVLTCGALSDQSNAGVKPSWSRWGVRDFRTKPDVSAPGDVTTSTAWNSTTAYSNKSGTSMSTPLLSSTMVTRIHASSWYNDKPEALRARAVASAKNHNTLSSGQYLAPQTGQSSRQTTGWGLINAKNMVFGSTQSTGYTYAGTFTGSGQGYTTSQITLPSDTQYVRLVMVITEPAASSGATKARRNDVRMRMDIYPFTAGHNTGEVSAWSSLQTVIVYNSYYMVGKDKRIKLKAYAQSIVASQARWAMCLYVYRKSPMSVAPNLTISGPTIMKPSTSADFTTTLSSPSTKGQFHSGRISLVDGSFTMNSMRRTTAANYTQWYYPSNTHPSYPHPRVTSGSNYGMTVGSSTSRPLIWNLRAPSTSGTYSMTAYGRYQSGYTTISLKTAGKSVCVDGLAPNAIRSLTSTRPIRTWSNSTSITHTWARATDNGCAGVSLLRYVASTTGIKSPTTSSPSLSSLTTARTNTFAHGTLNYFSIRVYDRAGNFSGYVYRGPYWIDTVRPVITSVVINSGATRTSSSTVSVRATATDSGSGAYQMRYSGNNSSWTAWMPYTSGSRTVALGSYGWTSEGTRACYVQVRDRAGNVSTTRFDTISWIRPPNITGATISVLPNVTRSYYRLTGTDFIGTNLVTFGGVALAPYTSANDDWWNGGAYRILSDNVMYVYPPQGRAPGSYQIRCRNAYYYGTPRNVSVTFQNGRVLYTNSASTAGKPFTMNMARSSSEPSSTLGLIIVSPVKSPSNAPGIVSLEIGLNFSAYLEVIRAPFNSSTRCLKLTVPTLASYKGVTAWFEGVYLRNPLPLPTTNAWSVTLK